MSYTTRAELVADGMTDRRIRAAVACGELVRLRRGHFAPPDIDGPSERAGHIGGRLACLSELRHRGVWVLDSPVLHVQVEPNSARLRRLDRTSRLHWSRLVGEAEGLHVGIVDALVLASRCVERRAWVASLDSALHLGLLHPGQIAAVRDALPRSRRRWIALADRKSESGLESIARVIAADLGFRVRSQVPIPGVGRVDLVVENWVVVETDGAAFHDTAISARDRLRDARLIASGRAVVRPGYSLVVHDPSAVARELIGAVAAHRRVKNSGKIVARARRRARRYGFS